jgi:uncharacterized protein YoaH (UPF0181 family)
MKPSTVKKIVGAMRKRLEKILGPLPATLPSAHQQMYVTVSRSLKGKVDDTTLQRAFGSAAMLTIWTDMEQGLKDKPEPTPEQLKKILEEIEALDFASLVGASLKRISRKLPPFPPGKKPSLTLEQQQQALMEVHQLTTKEGRSRKKAYATVARKYGVHWRTIQNLWVKTQKQLRGEA